MGFGILFFSCFLTYFGALTPISAFTYVAGASFMLFALYKLSSQNKMFFVSMIGAFALLLVSITLVILYVFGIVNVVYLVFGYMQTFISPILIMLIMISISLIAKEVEIKKLQGWSYVNIGFVVVYLICEFSSIFISSVKVMQRVGLIDIISRVIFSGFALVILFNCYAKICYEDDRDMKKQDTGMPFFDFLNRAFNKATDKNRKNGPKDKGEK